MKHQAINLVKFSSLSRRLGLPRCWTIGILEGLWLFAQTNARSGDLSRFSADDLAGWLEYPGDAKELVDALVACSWLDEDGDPPRWSIHDWSVHKPNWLRGVEARQKPVPQPSSGPGYAPGAAPTPQPPSPPLPSPSLPNNDRSIGLTIMSSDQIVITKDEFGAVRHEMNELRDSLLGDGVKCTPRDKELIWKTVCLCHYQFKCPEWVAEIMRLVREARPKRPVAYFKTCLGRKLEKIGVDLNEELSIMVLEEN